MLPPELPTGHPMISKRPAYRQVMDAIAAWAQELAPGDRLGTEGDFVRRFGVSLVTVRQALQRLEHDGVIERRQGVGTFIPLEPLPRRHVAVYMEASPLTSGLSPYFLKLHETIRQALRELSISCRSYLGESTAEEAFAGQFATPDLLLDYRLERLSGVISIGVGSARRVFEERGKVEIPILDFQQRMQFGWDSKDTFLRKAIGTLKAQGRRRIGVIAWENPKVEAKPFYTRLRAIAQEMGVDIDERLLDLNAFALSKGMGWERFRDLWRARTGRPDGLIVLDDTIFDDCQRAISELGVSVPEQLGLFVGTSDARTLQPIHPATAYRISTALMGRRYAVAMQAMMKGEPVPPLTSVSELVELSGAEIEESTPANYLLEL